MTPLEQIRSSYSKVSHAEEEHKKILAKYTEGKLANRLIVERTGSGVILLGQFKTAAESLLILEELAVLHSYKLVRVSHGEGPVFFETKQDLPIQLDKD